MQNAINWFDIPVADLTRAMKFYKALTGMALRREPAGAPGEEMAMFTTADEQGVGGALSLAPHMQPSAQGSVVYLNAGPSIDAWLARVESAGGQITTPKTALPPGMGFFAYIIDSEGNRVGLHALA